MVFVAPVLAIAVLLAFLSCGVVWRARVTADELASWATNTGATRIRLAWGQIREVEFPGAGAEQSLAKEQETDLERAVRLMNSGGSDE